MTQRTIGVLRGGPSEAYDISLKSGSQFLQLLNNEPYKTIDLFIDKEGVWHRSGIPRNPEFALRGVDVVVNALHGTYGEDGTVQQLLERFSVPYTGSQSFPSRVCMNKTLTKKELEGGDILIPRYQVLHVSDDLNDAIFELWRSFPQPSIVKPVASGSSIGVSIARTYDGLREAIYDAFTYSPKVMIEEYIRGKEATCGVIDRFRNEESYALIPLEVTPPSSCGFYDYQAKCDPTSGMRCPGNFTEREKREMQRIARAVHKQFGLRDYSQSDFIVTPQGVYFLEVNTLPGMAEHSPFMHSLKSIGSSAKEFFDHLIRLATNRK